LDDEQAERAERTLELIAGGASKRTTRPESKSIGKFSSKGPRTDNARRVDELLADGFGR